MRLYEQSVRTRYLQQAPEVDFIKLKHEFIKHCRHLLYLAQIAYETEDSMITTDESFVTEQLFVVLKSFKDNYFSELHAFDTLEFEYEYDELADNEESDDEYEEMSDEGER
ncbi:unnamed protein product [Rotaria magnacalcarata]|uniref:Uncharacterized protein n=1 Tax=Rotaria magnacalcarata TaxID=392030 RepID=A0A8S2QWL4_9BILA|nr:unnamed protein product [Rotaria magnacalcarata]